MGLNITIALGQVKLPVGQVDLNKVFFYILYKKVVKMQAFGSWATTKFWNRIMYGFVETSALH